MNPAMHRKTRMSPRGLAFPLTGFSAAFDRLAAESEMDMVCDSTVIGDLGWITAPPADGWTAHHIGAFAGSR
jgi:hypothetical protein